MSFARPHLAHVVGGVVVEAAQVEQTVDDVERQFRLDVVLSLGRLPLGDLQAENEFPFEFFRSGATVWKCQDVGRFIVIEIALVEPMNRRVVNKSEADLVIRDTFAIEHGSSDRAHGAPVDGGGFRGDVDRDFAHGC